MAHTMNTGTIVAIVGDQSEDALANLDGIRGVEVLALQGSEPALAARRIAANFRYVAAVNELRRRRVAVRRLKAFAGPLPGIYRSRA